MVLQRSATFVGESVVDTRPGAKTFRTTMDTVTKDQARLYERITNEPIPGEGAILATPHNHDGTDGALIRIPLAQAFVGAKLPAHPPGAPSTPTNPGYGVFSWVPFFAPAGVSRVRVVGWTSDGINIGSFRATIHDENEVNVSSENVGQYWFQRSGDVRGASAMHFDDDDQKGMACTPGAINILKLEAWSGEIGPTGGIITASRDFIAWAVIPWPENDPPESFTEYVPFQRTDTSVKVPAAFTSIDDELVGVNTDYRSWNSYVLSKSVKNDALLYELATGLPAGYNADNHSNDVRRPGHNHKDDGGTSLDDAGIDIDHCLGAWHYGVSRADPGLVENRTRFDEVDDEVPIWHGRIFGVTIDVNPGTSFQIWAQHKVRIPAAIDDNVLRVTQGGPNDVTKLKLAIWCLHDEGKTGGMDFREITRDFDGLDPNAGLTASTVGTGTPVRELVTIDNIGVTDPVGDGRVQTIELAYRHTTINQPIASCVYGACLYYEA